MLPLGQFYTQPAESLPFPDDSFKAWQSNTIALTDENDIYSGDPKTPIFRVGAKTPTRIRLLYAGGEITNGTQQVFMLDGHSWQEEPFINDSTEIGDNPLSQELGSQQIVANQPLNLVLKSAGGTAGVTGDYALHSYLDAKFGNWMLMRVVNQFNQITQASWQDGTLQVAGKVHQGTQPVAGGTVFL